MLPLTSSPPLQQETQPLAPPKVDKNLEVSETAQNSELSRLQKLILSHQQTILSATKLVECLANCLQEPLPNNSIPLPGLDHMSDQEKYEQLLKTIQALDLYFKNSAITRKETRERWQSSTEESGIDQLNKQAKSDILSVLDECYVAQSAPLQITKEVPFLFPGAAVPRMYSRLNSEVLQKNATIIPPEIQVCLGTPRPLDNKIDFLGDSAQDQLLQEHIKALITQLNSSLGDQKTEAHAHMALVDMIRESDPECMLNQQPVYLCFTGELSYRKQSLQDSGVYEQGETIDGRPNTEATFKSALSALQQLIGAMPQELVLVSNQPHIAAQQLAAERVAALPEFGDLPSVSIKPCGDENPLADTHSIFLAIDSVRKTIQLLNPSYDVTTNWVQSPEWKLFKSSQPGNWQLLNSILQIPLERLI